MSRQTSSLNSDPRADTGVRETSNRSGTQGHLPYWQRDGYVAPRSTNANGTGAGSGQARNDISVSHMLDIYPASRFGSQTGSFGAGDPLETNAWQAIMGSATRAGKWTAAHEEGLLAGGANSRNPLYDPYPTIPNNNGPGGGGTYYGGGGGMTQAAWDKYQKEYLAMIAGFSPTQVGPAPIDDLTPLVNTAVDADLAHVAAAYGDVVPMDANAYQTTSRATTPSAAMYGGGLMDGQGFDAASARQNQVRRQGELNADAYLWDQHWDAESARTEQFNSARNADVETLGANAEALVEMQRAALLAAAGVKQQDQMDLYQQQRIAALNADTRRKEEAAMALLQQGLASGMDLSNLDLSEFMGGA